MSENKETAAMLTKAREEYAIAELSNDQYIAGIQAKVLSLPPATEKDGYELRRKTIADLRKIRTTIEARRKELKADSLAYGRRIDAFAKHWTAQIEAIEQPLVLEKQAVDEAKEKIKREAEEAERRRQEEEARQRLQAEEARLAEIRKVEEAKLAEEREKLRAAAELLRKIEQDHAAEQGRARAEHLAKLQEIDRQQKETAAKQKAEQDVIDADRRQLAEEKAQVARVAAEKQRLHDEEKIRKEREQAEIREMALREAERLERAERIKPDVAKLREYMVLFEDFKLPGSFRSEEAAKVANDAHEAVILAGRKINYFIQANY